MRCLKVGEYTAREVPDSAVLRKLKYFKCVLVYLHISSHVDFLLTHLLLIEAFESNQINIHKLLTGFLRANYLAFTHLG